tara:strand:- start:658 stop:819 length:162 start_codon:yes stop_codon:yes gene_type:complete
MELKENTEMKIVVVYCPIYKEIYGVYKKGSISEKKLNELGSQDYYVFEETLTK